MNAKSEEQGLVPINTESILITKTGIDFDNFAGLWTVANMILKAKMAPAGLDTPHAIALVMARGRSVGLDPFQSMESMAVVNGRVMIWGDAPLAIARQHPDWQESAFREEIIRDEKGEILEALCVTQRKGGTVRNTRFTIAQAKKAGLWGKTGPWTNYPERMMQARARGYALRDNFGDALKGLAIRETFDEDVDGKPVESNGDQLRGEMEKRKTKTATASMNNNAGTIKEAVKQSFPETRNETVERAVKSDASHVFFSDPQEPILDQTDLDIARDLLKGVYNRIPEAKRRDFLKEASMDEEGTWRGIEHIDKISDVDYLNLITTRLEEMLTQVKGAKA
jgi:hypothetical protein